MRALPFVWAFIFVLGAQIVPAGPALAQADEAAEWQASEDAQTYEEDAFEDEADFAQDNDGGSGGGEPSSRQPSAPTSLAPPSAASAPAPRAAPAAAQPAIPSSGGGPGHQGPVMRAPVLVELFTAQGCASCPAADAVLADMAGREDVLVLSWHVDYWDYLGWPDQFARPEFTARQRDYAQNFGERSLATPQMIVGGNHLLRHIRPAELSGLIGQQRSEAALVEISKRADGPRREIALTPRSALPAESAVQLVRYAPQRRIEVAGGENNGRNLAFVNVVVAAETIARWDGAAPLRLTVTLGAGAHSAALPPDTRHAIIVQALRGGRPAQVIATVRLD
ncbi:MAG: DUF1223 domain-containing protein [Paracoccus sp. (in: a-proteobacteria)]|nr:DUF1223 domain-containing protein [Paracoccus sp. (in: a-proteobacteria)]